MAGAGYKLFNTGDVLTAAQVNTYLMEQTVMVFADAAARTAALSGVVSEGMISYLKDTNAVEVYDGSNWVASDDPNAIQNTIVDAKGDLISASAADTPARLAVGNNGETLVADSSASTGLRWQPYTYQNAVYNSSMNIWQRGTSVAIGTGNSYTADRWSLYRGVTGGTVSRQATSDTTNLPNIQYCARVQRDSGNTNTSVLYFRQTLETLDSIKFAGRQVALSFYARKGSNFSAASDLLRVYIGTGTGTDQSPISFTGEAANGDTNVTLTSTWQRFTITATLPTNTTEIYFNFSYTPVGTASTNDFFEITGVQFELGQVASPYKPMSVTLAGELAAAQRYYVRFNADQAYSRFGMGTAQNADRAYIDIVLKTTMRTASLTLDTSAVSTFFAENDSATAASSLTSLSILANGCTTNIGIVEIVKTGAFTSGRAYRFLANNSTSAYLGFSAEL